MKDGMKMDESAFKRAEEGAGGFDSVLRRGKDEGSGGLKAGDYASTNGGRAPLDPNESPAR